jgi:hypothetical protein
VTLAHDIALLSLHIFFLSAISVVVTMTVLALPFHLTILGDR